MFLFIKGFRKNVFVTVLILFKSRRFLLRKSSNCECLSAFGLPFDIDAMEVKVSVPSCSGLKEIKVSLPSCSGAKEIKVSLPSCSGAKEIKVSVPSCSGAKEIKVSVPSCSGKCFTAFL